MIPYLPQKVNRSSLSIFMARLLWLGDSCGKIVVTELGTIRLEHVTLFPDPSTNNRPGSEAIDHGPHNIYND